MGIGQFAGVKNWGGFLLLVASFGFLVYDSLFCAKVTETAEIAAAFGFGRPKQAYDAAISLAVIGGVLGVLVLVLLILGLLGVDLKKIGLILWVVVLVLFFGVLIAASVAVDTSAYADFDYDIANQRSYNETDAVKDYVDAYYKEYPAGSPFSQALSRAAEAKPKRAHLSGPKKLKADEPAVVCAPLWLEGIAELADAKTKVNGLDIDLRFYYSIESGRFPIKASDLGDDCWDETDPWDSGVIRDYNAWFNDHSVPAGYDLLFDADAAKTALDDHDPCALKFTDGKSAPGWSLSLLAKAICDEYTTCVDNVEAGRDVYGNNLPTVNPGPWPPCIWPEGWDLREDVNAAILKYKKGPEARYAFYGSAAAYHIANSILLGFAVVGAVFVVIGLVAEVLGQGGKVSSEQKP